MEELRALQHEVGELYHKAAAGSAHSAAQNNYHDKGAHPQLSQIKTKTAGRHTPAGAYAFRLQYGDKITAIRSQLRDLHPLLFHADRNGDGAAQCREVEVDLERLWAWIESPGLQGAELGDVEHTKM